MDTFGSGSEPRRKDVELKNLVMISYWLEKKVNLDFVWKLKMWKA